MQHIILSPLNVFFRSLKPKGALTPIDLETAETFGVGKIEEFTWKDLLDLDACTRCGRCQDACPAYLSGKPLSPKKLIQDLKDAMLGMGGDGAGKALIGGSVSEEEIWACTACGACLERCPVFIEQFPKIIELRRNLTLVQGKMPTTLTQVLRNMQQRGHPYAGAQFARLRGDWAVGLGLKALEKGQNADVLLWVGCSGALVDRNVEATLALVKLLQTAGVNFAILEKSETCCGDPARRVGYELQYQQMAQQNIATFKQYGVRKILTSCPHCFNTLKNEYTQFGGDFEVWHHSQFIADLIAQGKIQMGQGLSKTIVYHDSCYLGRFNGIFSPPRKAVRAIPGARLVEMGRRGSRSLCCGGGGGHLWIEETAGIKINEMRTEEALRTRAEVVVTACPYCLQMFEEGLEKKKAKEIVQARDISEIVLAASRKE